MTTDIRPLVDGAVEGLQAQAQQRGLELSSHVPNDVATISADPTRLKQVLINLIGNAIKFTETGRVDVRIDLSPETSQPRAIEVSDTGIGIAKNQQALVFDPFRQADASTSRLFGGTGLGLAIAQNLCREMGFIIELHSEQGVGSTFRIAMGNAEAAGNPRID